MMIQASITGKDHKGEPLYTVNINNELIINHLPFSSVVLTMQNWIAATAESKENSNA